MDIGFAGVGRMGRQFAIHLARAGHHVIAYDPVVRADNELSGAGISLVDDAAAIAGTSLSISMLPDAASARQLLEGAEGLFATAAHGHRHVLMGTMGVEVVKELSVEAERHGIGLADAPVSGSVAGARAGPSPRWSGRRLSCLRKSVRFLRSSRERSSTSAPSDPEMS